MLMDKKKRKSQFFNFDWEYIMDINFGVSARNDELGMQILD